MLRHRLIYIFGDDIARLVCTIVSHSKSRWQGASSGSGDTLTPPLPSERRASASPPSALSVLPGGGCIDFAQAPRTSRTSNIRQLHGDLASPVVLSVTTIENVSQKFFSNTKYRRWQEPQTVDADHHRMIFKILSKPITVFDYFFFTLKF